MRLVNSSSPTPICGFPRPEPSIAWMRGIAFTGKSLWKNTSTPWSTQRKSPASRIVLDILVVWSLMHTELSCTVVFLHTRQTRKAPKANYGFCTNVRLWQWSSRTVRWILDNLSTAIGSSTDVVTAGGQAVNSHMERMITVVPEHIHDRSGIFMGSYDEVQKVIEVHKKHAKWNYLESFSDRRATICTYSKYS